MGFIKKLYISNKYWPPAGILLGTDNSFIAVLSLFTVETSLVIPLNPNCNIQLGFCSSLGTSTDNPEMIKWILGDISIQI